MRGRTRRWSVITTMAVVAVFAGVSACSNELMDVDVEESEPETQEEPETYTVTFDRQGGSGGSTSVTVTVGEPMPEAVAPSKGSAVFGGYYLRHYSAPGGIGTQYYTAAMESAHDWDISSDVELVAHWVLQIGDEGPAGGIVFYDKGEYSDGWRYLEAAPASTEWTGKAWGGRHTEVGAGAQGTAIGTGAANTEAIVTTYGDEEPHQDRDDYAARLAADLIQGGFDEWFLPSRDELNLMYENLHEQGLGDFGGAEYWSSSEFDATVAREQRFQDGTQQVSSKSLSGGVRAARAF